MYKLVFIYNLWYFDVVELWLYEFIDKILKVKILKFYIYLWIYLLILILYLINFEYVDKIFWKYYI